MITMTYWQLAAIIILALGGGALIGVALAAAAAMAGYAGDEMRSEEE